MKIASLHVYPVKSLGGISLDTSRVEARGLLGDRRWMLVDENDQFLTQRTFAEMALLKVQSMDETGLTLRDAAGETIQVPSRPEGERRTVRVWKSEVDAIRVSDAADAWFTERLGQTARLVYMPDDSFRPTHPDFTRPGDQVSFADAFPVLVISQTSLDDLNARLETPIPMNRFRGNLIVEGSEPYAEDAWTGFTVGGVRYRYVKHCGRCRVTTTDQETAEVGIEPLRTLATYRREGNNVIFGTYFVPESEGQIRVGDALEIDPI